MTLNFPSIFDEILGEYHTPITTLPYKPICVHSTIAVKEVDGLMTIAVEAPRLVSNTVVVSVQKPALRTFQYELTINAEEITLSSYGGECKTTNYNRSIKFETSRPVALDGSLNLDYKEGVLVIGVPLQKPTEAKKQGLSARLV
ncbi:MAG: hypothetical protein IM613_12515 [Cytophagales bacterium]|nr:hypothetical protein [Cytophagales bacterium]